MASPTPLSYLTDEQKQEIKQLVCEILEVDESEVNEETRFRDDLSMDSLMAIEIVAALEKRLQVTIEQSDIQQIASLSGIYEIIEARSAG
ncbi:acyl carrier protein [Dactylosporangium roseum]|uniref:Acyl carrier protein n=1 Tax=Dactylosporangium roseum TaxID=47989 RepID=A0ABY5Z2R5_9ACTN|nr:acyl carrier protein [Dactylosporangium roseum]UWZ34769.1 acyl carrier protein [Dactylosporangium roseum]